jgi:hypothetical protein
MQPSMLKMRDPQKGIGPLKGISRPKSCSAFLTWSKKNRRKNTAEATPEKLAVYLSLSLNFLFVFF